MSIHRNVPQTDGLSPSTMCADSRDCCLFLVPSFTLKFSMLKGPQWWRTTAFFKRSWVLKRRVVTNSGLKIQIGSLQWRWRMPATESTTLRSLMKPSTLILVGSSDQLMTDTYFNLPASMRISNYVVVRVFLTSLKVKITSFFLVKLHRLKMSPWKIHLGCVFRMRTMPIVTKIYSMCIWSLQYFCCT